MEPELLILLSRTSQPRVSSYYQMVIGILILGAKFQPQNAMYFTTLVYNMQGNTHNACHT